MSVVVPCFNYGRFLADTLESVRKQSYQHWECIIVDDGSTDDTQAVVAHYSREDRRIRYVYQRHRGLAAARNRALRTSRGEYLQFLDADDLIEPLKLEYHVRYLAEHPDVGIVYSPVRYFRTEAKEERRYSRREPDVPWMPGTSGQGAAVISMLANDNVMAVNCALVTRAVVVRTGLFVEGLRAYEDWDYWMRCAVNDTRFQYVDAKGTYALVRHHALSMLNDKPRIKAAFPEFCGRAARLARDSGVRALLRAKAVAGWKDLALLHIRDRMPLRGALNALKLGLSYGEYRFALKYFVCLSLLPFTGREKFVTLFLDVSFPKTIRAYFSR